MKKIIIYRITVAALLLGWMLLIFSMSAQNAKVSSSTSGSLIETVLKFLNPDFENLSDIQQQALIEPFQFIVRKTAHFTAYAVLSILAFLNAVTLIKYSVVIRGGIALVFSLLYSISDEIHQLFVPGRSGELRDVLIDFCGAAIGIVFALLLFKAIKNRLTKKQITA